MENDGFHCEYVSFNTSFSSGTVRVFASINHGSESIGVHDTAFVWVEDVTTSRFKACLVRGGQVAGENTTIDWFAIQGSNFQPDVYDGKASFSLFTTGTQCKQVAFPQVRLLNNELSANNNLLFIFSIAQWLTVGKL